MLAARLEDWKKARSDEWKEVYRLDGISGGKICLVFLPLRPNFQRGIDVFPNPSPQVNICKSKEKRIGLLETKILVVV